MTVLITVEHTAKRVVKFTEIIMQELELLPVSGISLNRRKNVLLKEKEHLTGVRLSIAYVPRQRQWNKLS